MAELTLIYGTMESGKTTKLMQDNFNYQKHGHKVVIIKPLIDVKGKDCVITRTNEKRKADILLDNDESLFEDHNLQILKKTKIILVDEAQFLSFAQIKELWEVAHALDMMVVCYALKSDFRGRLFEGTAALMGYADKKIELLVNCKCGKSAVFNARKVNNKFITDGDVVAIDGENNVSYVPLCSDCYYKIMISSADKRKLRLCKNVVKS